ncbi:hypothetical protein PF008_g31998, partial [Phytophthora fragariae]
MHLAARASSSNDTLFQTDDRVAPYHHFKTHTFVNQNTQTPTTAPSVQGYVNGPGYAVTSASESAGVLTINLQVNSAATATSYGSDLSTLVVTVTKTQSDSVRVKIVDKSNKRWEVPKSIFTAGTLGSDST